MTQRSSLARDARGRDRGGRDTREILILTAERLFAERGIDAVSLREVAAEAGSRNSSAAQYHFGNKDDLLREILVFRLQTLNQQRAALLTAVGPDASVRELLRTLVEPLAGLVDDTRYLPFLARLQSDYTQSQRALDVPGSIDVTFREACARLAEALPELTPERFQFRFRLVTRMAITTLGEHALRQDRSAPDTATVVAELLDAATGVLQAPNAPS